MSEEGEKVSGRNVVSATKGAADMAENGLTVGNAHQVAGSVVSLAGNASALKNGGCFAAGTPLLIPGGSRRIEDFRPGDWVLSLPEDDDDALPVPRRVEEVFENDLSTMGLRIGGIEIRTTIEHPFWVQGRGWTPANLLVEGDRLRSHDGTTVVLGGVERSLGLATVYNLRIAEYHTYFVG